MARIRSIHPGFFTDEAVLSCSVTARLLYIGLWCEADCQGVFPWKPVQLKVRILPMEPIRTDETVALLNELADADLVHRFEVDGEPYGVIKSFGKFQRPKNPSRLHPLPEHYRKYAAEGAAIPTVRGDQADLFPQEDRLKVVALPQRSPSAPLAGGENPRMESETEEEGRGGGTGEEAPRKRGARLPEDWEPTPELVAYGVNLGFTDREVRNIAERFRLHWHSSAQRNALKLDWNKAFQGWLRDDQSRRAERNGGQAGANRPRNLGPQVF